jgi:hypothetical protein
MGNPGSFATQTSVISWNMRAHAFDSSLLVLIEMQLHSFSLGSERPGYLPGFFCFPRRGWFDLRLRRGI